MTSGLRSERGIALALAVFALVLIGALVSAAVVVGRLDRATAENSVYAAEAQAAAETGLNALQLAWDPAMPAWLPIWDGTTATEWSSGLASLSGNPLVVYVDSVRRLNRELFLVRSLGRRLDAAGGVLSEVGLGRLFRTVQPTVGVNAALTVLTPATFVGDGFAISGINDLPPFWSTVGCDPLDAGGVDDVVGVRSATLTGLQASDGDNVDGFPSLDAPNDPSVTSATLNDFADLTYASLAGQPGVKGLPSTAPYAGIGPTVDGLGACDRTSPLNLGEPWRNPPAGATVIACQDYFPVVHGTGASTAFAPGARGQGILLVDGDLYLAGGFDWVGLVVVQGRVSVSGTGNAISGAVLAHGGSLLTAGATPAIRVTYSACAIQQASGGATRLEPLGQRSWFQIY